MTEKVRIRAYGVVGIVMIVAIVGVLLGMYQKAFTPYVEATVVSDRAGLLLDKGAKVRAFGLTVGEVRDARVAGDRVEIDIVIEREHAELIPSDVSAAIEATTVFGAKFVDLKVPKGDVTQAIASGQVIESTGVTVEANDVFQNALGVIESVDPVALNTTLTSMANAFDGRGDRLGQLLERSDSYLKTFNESLPALEEDLERAPSVLKTYADVVPDFLDIGEQASVTSRTIRQRQADLHQALETVTSAAGTVTHFLKATESPLEQSMRSLRPTLSLVGSYDSTVTCIVNGLESVASNLGSVLGAQRPGIQGLVALVPAADPYTYPKNLPQFALGYQPACSRIPSLENPAPSGRPIFNDGTQEVYQSPDRVEPRLPLQIYTDAFEDFFGTGTPGGNRPLDVLFGFLNDQEETP